MNYAQPTIDTHVAAMGELPKESAETDVDRPDLPVPHLWQNAVIAINRKTGQKVIVASVVHATMQFRPYYPDQPDPKTGAMGRFASRTEWYSFGPGSDWEAETTLSPAELERQAAQDLITEAIANLSAKDAALVEVLCDSDDPKKNYAKMTALMNAGVIKAPKKAKADE